MCVMANANCSITELTWNTAYANDKIRKFAELLEAAKRVRRDLKEEYGYYIYDVNFSEFDAAIWELTKE